MVGSSLTLSPVLYRTGPLFLLAFRDVAPMLSIRFAFNHPLNAKLYPP